MAYIPAICDTCGTWFSSRGFEVQGTGAAKLINCAVGPCPTCGGLGAIPSGTYEVVENAVRSFIALANEPDELQRLAAILANAQQRDTSPNILAESIEEQAPALSEFASWIRQYLMPKNSGEVTGLISMILAAIALILSLQPTKQEFDEKTVSTIVEKAVEAALLNTAQARQDERPDETVNQRQETPKPIKRATKKIGRNDPCPCLSGKKYKLCCIGKRTQAPNS